jgi:hypothetical protein
MNKAPNLPALPLEEWKKSKITLHLFFQIVGKVKLAMMPYKNHWWNITLRLSSKGLTTGPIPHPNGMGNFTIEFNFLKHNVQINSTSGGVRRFDIIYGLPVSKFYSLLLDQLQQLNIPVIIKNPFPYDMGIDQHFNDILNLHHYDPNYVQKFWKILLWADNCFKEFEGRYRGKSSPVQLFWHHMDLVVTRFSGKRAVDYQAKTQSDKEAYSHENISFGFWAGDDQIPEPSFYSYTFPNPEGLERQPLKPDAAKWIHNNGSPMAILPYHKLIESPDPKLTLLEFMESAWQAGTSAAGWNLEDM